MFAVAFGIMHDIGFTPPRRAAGRSPRCAGSPPASIDYGWRVPGRQVADGRVAFAGGVGIYALYALQPYLLELYGDPEAYQIAGLAAAIVAGAQILGGMAAPRIRGLFHRRTSALIAIASTERGSRWPDRAVGASGR